MAPSKMANGMWQVYVNGWLQSFKTNAEAWRYLDKARGELTNKSEARSEWSQKQMGNDE